MKDLQIFNYQDTPVRTVVIDDEPWFVLADLCKVLDIANPSDVASRVDDDALGIAEVIDSIGRTQHARTVNEAGMYEVVFLSRRPSAKDFKRWVTREVLPSIRKHGMYATADTVEAMLSDPDTMIRTLTALKEEKAARAELEARAEMDKPKVIFADAVSASTSTVLIGELAKILRGNGVDIGQNRLFERLRNDGFLIRRKGSDWNMPTQRSMDLGLFFIKETAITHSDGHVSVSKTTKVTGKGQQYFIELFLTQNAA